MASRSDAFDQEMLQLEAEIKRLEAEYNMFFAGRLPRLPWEARARVEALVRRYDRMNLRNTAQRFRFETLQGRFTAFCDLWERQLKAKEEGRTARGGRGAARAPAPPPAAAAAPQDRSTPGPRVVTVVALRDPSTETDRLRELYERLSAARRDAGEAQIPFERFTEVVRAQVRKLGSGGAEVAFRVAVQDGKVTLTARPMKEEK